MQSVFDRKCTCCNFGTTRFATWVVLYLSADYKTRGARRATNKVVSAVLVSAREEITGFLKMPGCNKSIVND